MSATTVVRSFRKPTLSPEGEEVRKALIEATKIVDESSVGKFLLKQDSPEGFAILVSATQKLILCVHDE